MPRAELRSTLEGLANAYKALALLDLVKAALILEGGTKVPEGRGLPGGSGINPRKPLRRSGNRISTSKDSTAVEFFVPIIKKSAERREVTGIVLTPEVVDAQGDIISAVVIEKAAGDFLAGFNDTTKLGLMHNDFKKRFELRQSFIVPSEMSIDTTIVKVGTWLMVVKVLEDKQWESVKDGTLNGFSIGGRARTIDVSEEEGNIA